MNEREVVTAFDLDQRQVCTGVGANHLGGVAFAVIGGHVHLLGLVDHMVVGHRITISRDEESGALTHGVLAPLRPRSLPVAVRPTEARCVVGLTEAAEEILERRAAQRIVFVQSKTVATRIHLNFHRNDRGLYLFNDVGEADRPLRVLRVREGGREQCAPRRIRRPGETGEQHAGTEASGGCKENDATLGKEAMPRIPGCAR